MSISRETIFTCSYSTPTVTRTARILAWSAREAAQAFREALAEEGITARTVRVAPPRRQAHHAHARKLVA